eukprot:95625-Amphidinium_carterae.3
MMQDRLTRNALQIMRQEIESSGGKVPGIMHLDMDIPIQGGWANNLVEAVTRAKDAIKAQHGIVADTVVKTRMPDGGPMPILKPPPTPAPKEPPKPFFTEPHHGDDDEPEQHPVGSVNTKPPPGWEVKTAEAAK